MGGGVSKDEACSKKLEETQQQATQKGDEVGKLKAELEDIKQRMEKLVKEKEEDEQTKAGLEQVKTELQAQIEALVVTNLELQQEISLIENEDDLTMWSLNHDSMSHKQQSLTHNASTTETPSSTSSTRFRMGVTSRTSNMRTAASSGFTLRGANFASISKRMSRTQQLSSPQRDTNRSPAAVAKTLRMYQKRDNRQNSIGSNSNNDIANAQNDVRIKLPRGGIHVTTRIGPVQFGAPPETLKDSMNLGIPVPTLFVVPRERFNLHSGINASEIEFPAFFNFFVLKKKVTLITYPKCANDLLTMMKEALDGPGNDKLYVEEEYSKFCDDETFAARPDHVKEIAYFMEPREPDFTSIEVKNLIQFKYFDDAGECDLGDGIKVRDVQYGFTITDRDSLVAVVSDEEAQSCYLPPDEEEQQAKKDGVSPPLKKFQIPKFGITILGSSHGFDPSGSTSGFVIWVNGQGIMVDPPPHSGQILMKSGIQPKSITATILTHCHADHDAGTIQKMITEDKVTLMTTRTVFESLLRKYSGVSGLATEFLEQLVHFRPVFVEEPTYWNGACFRFFYSLHAIPCVGFEVKFEGKSLYYSADTYYDPDGLELMHQKGVLSEKRKEALKNFAWNCDVVLHEAGVAPIHTPLEALKKLPVEVQENLYLIHIGGAAAANAEKQGFRVVKEGVKDTIILRPHEENTDTLGYLQLIAMVDIFKGFAISQALELLLMSQKMSYKAGDVIAKEGTPGDKFIIIMSGEASVSFGDTTKIFRTGDYLGEISIITGAKRTATIMSHTDSVIVEVDKYAFTYFLMKDRHLARRMDNLVKARSDGSWQAIASNSVLRNLSTNQKTQLQALLTMKEYKKGDIISKVGEQAKEAMIISDGELIFVEVHNVNPRDLLTATRTGKSNMTMQEEALLNAQQQSEKFVPFEPLSTGTFICDIYGMNNNAPLSLTLVCDSPKATVFLIPREAVLTFLDGNPMVLLSLLKTLIIQ